MGETDTPIQNAGDSGWTGPKPTWTRGWTWIDKVLATAQKFEGNRLVPCGL